MFKNISSDIFQYGIKPFLIPDKKRIANKAYNCIGNLIAERQLNRVCFTNLTIDINIYLLNDPDDYKIKYNIIQDLHTHFNNGPNRHQAALKALKALQVEVNYIQILNVKINYSYKKNFIYIYSIYNVKTNSIRICKSINNYAKRGRNFT